VALFQESTHGADFGSFVREIDVRATQLGLGVNSYALINSPTDKIENVLSINIARCTNAAATKNAAIVIDENVWVCRVHLTLREKKGEARRGDAIAIAKSLKLTVTAPLAEGANMVPLDKEHLEDALANISQLFGLGFYNKPWRRWLRAGCLRASVDTHGANTTAPMRYEIGMGTEARDIDASLVRRREDRLTWPRRNIYAVEGKFK